MRIIITTLTLILIFTSSSFSYSCQEECTSGFAFFAQFNSDGSTRINQCISNCGLQRQMAELQKQNAIQAQNAIQEQKVQKDILRCKGNIQVIKNEKETIAFCE